MENLNQQQNSQQYRQSQEQNLQANVLGCVFLPAVSGTYFIGNLNTDGSVLKGNWRTASRSYVKVSY